MRILLIEDEQDIREIIGSFLSDEGYDVAAVSDGEKGLEELRAEEPDLVLLDVMLPGKDGWQILKEIRKTSDAAVIMLTALGRTDDKVKGLSGGADDYIHKPFDLAEMKSRMEAVLRRTRPQLAKMKLAIDDKRKLVRVHGKEIALSPKEYNLIKLLASRPGKVFSSKEILEELWPGSKYATSQDVQKYAYLLRKKLEKDPADPNILMTVRGFGYRLAL